MMTYTAAQFHSALKAVIKRAIIVLDALGDSELRFQNTGQVWGRAIDPEIAARMGQEVAE
jgi:hypothetical protein